MRDRPRFLDAAATVLLGFLTLAPPVSAGEPLEAIRSSTDQIIGILQDTCLRERPELRDQKLWGIISSRFDFDEMARRSLALHWRERSQAERAEFKELFSRLLYRTYVEKLKGYTDEKIEYPGEEISDRNAVVKTKLFTKSQEIAITYKLKEKSSSWRVYDVVIEGVSLVSNYRNQFHRIVTSQGYPELLKRLRAKNEELTKEADKEPNERR